METLSVIGDNMKGLKDNLTLTGLVTITLRDADGHIKERAVENTVVTVGKQHVADQLSGKLQASMSHMALGDGAIAADISDTQLLGTEIDRKAFTSVDQGTGADANKIIYTCDWPSGEADGAITEAGIFNASSGGTMLCRTTFPVKNKGAGDSLSVTWILTVN